MTHTPFTPEQEADMIRFHRDKGISLARLADLYETTPARIKKVFKRHGVAVLLLEDAPDDADSVLGERETWIALRLYVQERWVQSRIERLFDLPTGSLRGLLSRNRSSLRREHFTRAKLEQEVCEVYSTTTIKIREICKRYGIGTDALYRILNKHGVPRRNKTYKERQNP